MTHRTKRKRKKNDKKKVEISEEFLLFLLSNLKSVSKEKRLKQNAQIIGFQFVAIWSLSTMIVAKSLTLADLWSWPIYGLK